MSTSLTTANDAMVLAGLAANKVAERDVFANYAIGQSDNTLRRQRGDLKIFVDYICSFLKQAGISECPSADDLMTKPEAWHGVTWGMVEKFRDWMMTQGYAVGSVNVRLSTVKTYAKLANKAGILTTEAMSMIRNVEGYSRKKAKSADEKRTVTRTGHKKANAVSLTKAQADSLKAQPDTPQGRRDAVIMALLLDHGLRVGELAALEVSAFNLKDKTMTFYRQKVDKWQTHKLTADSYAAVSAWLNSADAPAMASQPLLRGSRKGGKLEDFARKDGKPNGMTERALTKRVRDLGAQIDVDGLSAHDCRHYWATRAARQGTDPFALQEAGGWSSLAMPRRYVESAKIANEGVKL